MNIVQPLEIIIIKGMKHGEMLEIFSPRSRTQKLTFTVRTHQLVTVQSA